jgi:hypothetical protein
LDIEFRPISQWPGVLTARRKRAQFRASYSDTLTLLKSELRQLAAREIAIQIAVQTREIRNDGLPRADMRAPSHPGVILSFVSKHGPLSYPCDVFDDWRDNLRAIALSLEHLRAVDRYGVTRRGEQYRGWAALPAPKPAGLNPGQAVDVLLKAAGRPSAPLRREELEAVYRAAVLATHPDRGGDAEAFRAVQEAHEVLARYWGVGRG